MGKLIDADLLAERLQDFVDWCRDERKQGVAFVLDCLLPNSAPVEAIPKDQYEQRLKENNELINDLEELRTMINKFAESYENRLKADVVAMLTDMLIDVEEIESREQWCDYANDNCISRYDVEDLIQQKINALKGEIC